VLLRDQPIKVEEKFVEVRAGEMLTDIIKKHANAQRSTDVFARAIVAGTYKPLRAPDRDSVSNKFDYSRWLLGRKAGTR
jgi:hypothetical protein